MVPKKIIMLAGGPSHGPGEHEYEQTARLFKVALEQSALAEQLNFLIVSDGWPKDETILDGADLIIVYTDGRDGDLGADVPFAAPERMERMQSLMHRGCGLLLLHFSTFVTREEGKQVLEWAGGYFEWEDEQGERNWFSRIDFADVLQLSAPEHPVTRGVEPVIPLNDEVYYRIRFNPSDPLLVPIARTPQFVIADEPLSDVVAWAIERRDGGRGFGTTIGHAYRLWKDDNYRKLMLNAIIWTSGLTVPETGVGSRFYSASELAEALPQGGLLPALAVPERIRVLLLSGNDAHKWHNWEETTPAIVAALQEDQRLTVDVIYDPKQLGVLDLGCYDAIALNYCNWLDPAGMAEPSKLQLLAYLKAGGGLAVLHFADGAFHFSLPEAGESDWPAYRDFVARVWNHHGASAHDEYGEFIVQPTDDGTHPVAAGIPAFTIRDELYFNQEGQLPVQVLFEAKSTVTGQLEPLVWVYSYKSARVYQSLLGHSAESYHSPHARQLLRQGVLWAAGRIG